MPFTHTITRSYSVGSRTPSATTSYTGDVIASLNVAIPTASDGLLVPFAMERGQGIVSMVMMSDQAMVVYTNADAGGATDTITLVANVPYIWHTGWYVACKITADITALYVDQSSGSTATLQIEILTDALA